MRRYGKNYESMRGPRGRKRTAASIPPPPILSVWQQFIAQAYERLCTCRPIGFGAVGPIPWSDIVGYAQAFGIAGDQRELFVGVIELLDEDDMKEQAKRAERESQPG